MAENDAPEPKKTDQPSAPSLDFRLETFALRLNRAFELNKPVTHDYLVRYNGQPMRLVYLPTQDLRAAAGFGHFEWDIKNRAIIPWPLPEGKWPAKPEMCPVADGHRGVWVDRDHLACPGCGMDFT